MLRTTDAEDDAIAICAVEADSDILRQNSVPICSSLLWRLSCITCQQSKRALLTAYWKIIAFPASARTCNLTERIASPYQGTTSRGVRESQREWLHISNKNPGGRPPGFRSIEGG